MRRDVLLKLRLPLYATCSTSRVKCSVLNPILPLYLARYTSLLAPKPAKKEGAVDAPGKKTLKSGEIASTWSDDASRKKPAEKRDAPAAPGREGWRAGGKSKSGGRKGGRGANNAQADNREPAPIEFIAREIHVPETISVADLAHKMSIKAGRGY
jgi:hypothetical protein